MHSVHILLFVVLQPDPLAVWDCAEAGMGATSLDVPQTKCWPSANLLLPWVKKIPATHHPI